MLAALVVAAVSPVPAMGATKNTTPKKSSTKTTASKNTGFPASQPNDTGVVVVKSKPARVISLSPTATEMLFAIGAGEQVVAVDDQSNYPDNAPKSALSGYQPNLEAIVKYKPDFVVMAQNDKVTAGLKKLKVPVLVHPAATTLEDSYLQITNLGVLTGNAVAAKEVVNEMKAKIARIVSTTPKVKVRFFHELDPTLYSVTSKSFIGQMYSLLGMENIADSAAGAESGYPQLNAEFLVKSNPDVIFLADTKCCGQNAEEVAKRPGWSALSSVQRKAVVSLDDDVASRWGPRVPELLETIATAAKKFAPVPAAA